MCSLLNNRVEFSQKISYIIKFSFEYNTQIFAGQKNLSCGPHLAREQQVTHACF